MRDGEGKRDSSRKGTFLGGSIKEGADNFIAELMLILYYAYYMQYMDYPWNVSHPQSFSATSGFIRIRH